MNSLNSNPRHGFRSRSRFGLLALLFVLAAAGPASAQAQEARGTIEGRLVNGTNSAQVPAKTEVEVISLAAGMSALKSAASDASGRFRFDGLPTDAAYMVRATYKSVNYHTRVLFDASGKAQVQLQVFEPTTSASGVRLEGLQMAVQLNGDRLATLESYSFRNDASPPRAYVNPDGTFRFSKAPGLLEPPRMDVKGPGSSMPLGESPLESADGQSYYTVYPMRPGVTAFEVAQTLPYTEQTYTFRKRFYQDTPSFQLGVRPLDMKVTGEGLVNVKNDPAQNIAVYSGGPVKAGTEVVWTFSGGTPITAPPVQNMTGPTVRHAPTAVAQYALVIGPLLMLGLVGTLWYAINRLPDGSAARTLHLKELRERREQLLRFVADLDNRHETQAIERGEYMRQREAGKRQLRRITLMLGRAGKSSR